MYQHEVRGYGVEFNPDLVLVLVLGVLCTLLQDPFSFFSLFCLFFPHYYYFFFFSFFPHPFFSVLTHHGDGIRVYTCEKSANSRPQFVITVSGRLPWLASWCGNGNGDGDGNTGCNSLYLYLCLRFLLFSSLSFRLLLFLFFIPRPCILLIIIILLLFIFSILIRFEVSSA